MKWMRGAAMAVVLAMALSLSGTAMAQTTQSAPVAQAAQTAPGAASGSTSAATHGIASAYDETQALVLEVRLDGHVLSDSLLAYPSQGEWLLPLGELARLLTLAINVDAEGGQAAGFVVREEQGFGLNVGQGLVQVNGRSATFKPWQVVLGDDIYVAQRLLSQWLPLDLLVDMPTLQLRIKPRVILPMQARLARERAGGPADVVRAVRRVTTSPCASHPLPGCARPSLTRPLAATPGKGATAPSSRAPMRPSSLLMPWAWRPAPMCRWCAMRHIRNCAGPWRATTPAGNCSAPCEHAHWRLVMWSCRVCRTCWSAASRGWACRSATGRWTSPPASIATTSVATCHRAGT